jgi:hypothetical protein
MRVLIGYTFRDNRPLELLSPVTLGEDGLSIGARSIKPDILLAMENFRFLPKPIKENHAGLLWFDKDMDVCYGERYQFTSECHEQ